VPRTRIIVEIPGETPYDVLAGDGVLDELGDTLRQIDALSKVSKVCVITDSNVAPHYLARVKSLIAAAGFEVIDIVVEAGENSKCIDVAAEIWSALASMDFGRDSACVALGGGVVGDLCGFCASTYMRGIPFVQVPTTLLAMVDSSVGGKTGVNLEEGKNLVGTFTQPSYVCASVDTLATLNDREWACGAAEVAKSAALSGDDFFFWLMDAAADLAAHDTEAAREAVKRCVVFKAGVVAQDECETSGVRECLNYGHTLGHAIELLSGYGHYSHGACVAEGMRFAAVLSRILDEDGDSAVGISAEFADAQAELLDTLGLARLDFTPEPADVLAAMKRDKKTRGGNVRFVLVGDAGRWSTVAVSDKDILRALEVFYG
jgi:3-dehydroquinate synthase